MNQIIYSGRTIKDEDIAIGGNLANNLMLYQALISEELKPDTFSFNLIHNNSSYLYLVDSNGKYLTDKNGKFLIVSVDNQFDPEAFRFGAPLKYYINNGSTLVGQFYVRTVRRVDKNIYHFECTSAIGLTTYYGHNGGVYNGERLDTLIADIMGSLPYTIDADLAQVTCTGWLPKVKAARDNLQALLFMSGGSVKKNSNGTVNFGYIGSGTAKTIPNTNLNVGATISYLEPATRIEVTSHEYHALQTDETVQLFNNANGIAVSHLVVDFDEPCHDLIADGLTIEESGANYAIVSGVGTLSGQKYTHNTSLYAIDTESDGEPNVIQVMNNFMVNPGNVANVTKRISNYYGIAKEVDYLIRVTNERPGDKVTFKDPWGDQQTGYIKEMNVTLSKRLNANTKIALNWTPGPFGDSYTQYRIFRASDISNGRLSIPTAMRGAQALIVLLSGAGGGQAGYNGASGTAPSGLENFQAMAPGPGGAGGNPGQPGERGRIYSFYESSLPVYYDNAAIGAGGAGGASNGALGSPGGDTTLGSYSTANGSQMEDDYTNFLTGDAYGTLNVEGEAGSAGGVGAGRGSGHDGESASGDDHVCEDGTVNAGGVYANPVYYSYAYSGDMYDRWTGGAGGGGAAHGSSGSDGYTSTNRTTEETKSGSWGGDGADAIAPDQAVETQAGRGGHGGGGGGGAAQCQYQVEGSPTYTYGNNHGGAGGQGSAGGQGGDGLIIVYYNPAV